MTDTELKVLMRASDSALATIDYAKLSRDLEPAVKAAAKLSRDLAAIDYAKLSRDLEPAMKAADKLSRDLATIDYAKL